jgi:hypothetical protein
MEALFFSMAYRSLQMIALKKFGFRFWKQRADRNDSIISSYIFMQSICPIHVS